MFVALCLAVGSAVGMNSARTADYRVGEAGRAEAMAAEGHLERRCAEQVLISAAPPGAALDVSAARAAVRDLTARMERLGCCPRRSPGSGGRDQGLRPRPPCWPIGCGSVPGAGRHSGTDTTPGSTISSPSK